MALKNKYHAFILFYAALKFYMHKIALLAFKKHSLWINLHPKMPSQASTLFTFIAAFASVGKIGVVFKGYKLIKIALTQIFKIG